MTYRRLFAILPLALALAPQSMLKGQATSSLRGGVTDAQGSMIEAAAVRLQSIDTGFNRNTLTDNGGAYQFAQVPPGAYTIVVQKTGFAVLTQTNVVLLVNTARTLNVSMEVASVSESVNVEAEAAKINAVDASIGNAFNESQVRQLPLLTRNVVELLSLQAGVTPTGEVLGARRDQNNVSLDGVDVNDNQTSGLENSKGNAPMAGYNFNSTGVSNGVERPGGFNAALPVPLDSVQEFRVTVGGQGANQGRSSGGQVTLVTKSGTNQFHGSAYEYHRNTVTSANNWFSNRAGIPREQLIRNQFGASVGGPIKKDRVFFFGNFEQRIDASAANQFRKVPSETFKQGNLLVEGSDGVTYRLTPNDVRSIDPLHLGASQPLLDIFKKIPAGNDPASGLDLGLNFSGFRFNAPLRLDYKAYVAKLDFRLDEAGLHTLSVRGTLADNVNDELLAQYPGQEPTARLLNNSRGISALYTAVIKSTLINVATFGLTRIGLERTGSQQVEFTFDNVDALQDYTRGFIRIAPTYNFADDLTWTKGRHTVTGGVNLRFVRNNRTNFKNAFPSYQISRGLLAGLSSDIVEETEDFLRARTGNPALKVANDTTVGSAFGNMVGLLAYGSLNYSYQHDGKPLPVGVPALRKFASNEAELYIADTWRAKPSLTLTYGLRWAKYGVPYEKEGLQVAPIVPMQAFWAERLGGMKAGIPTHELPNSYVRYEFNGPANGKPSWYQPDNNNFAPRLSFAYSPGGKSGWMSKLLGKGGVIRGGAAVTFDRFGSDLVTQFDTTSSFGLNDLQILGPSINFTTGGRYNGTLPTLPLAPQHTFPFTPPDIDYIGGDYIAISTDLRTPYSYVFNMSAARELPGGLTMEVGYAGRLSRKLLMQTDPGGWAILFKDPKSGIVWKEMAREMRDNWNAGVDPRAVETNPGLIKLNPFVENQMKGLTNFFFPGSASANYYNLLWGQMGGSDADAMHQVDRIRRPELGDNCMSTSGCFTFYARQSSNVSMWTNIGFAAYHGGTLSIRKPFSKGFSFDVNYTISHSIDNGGAPESGGGQHGGIMLNPYDFRSFRGSSDFDIRHNLNINGLYELPFGKGKKFLNSASKAVDQLVGGWQISSIMRYRSGLPTAVAYTGLWPTNFSFQTIAYPVGPYDAKVQYNDLGNPSLFASTADSENWKPMYPGDVGLRAAVRLDDFLNFDIAVGKAFRLPWEGHRLQFRAEAFNAFNNVNFLDPSLDANSPGAFGQFNSASAPRVMQFALRYEF